jgi:hypothetical protein
MYSFKFHSSLKLLQIASLIGNDRALSNYNISIPMENLTDVIREFVNVYRCNEDSRICASHFLGNFSRKYETNWTRIWHKTGFCFTFNFPNSSQFFHLDELSEDFNYDLVIRMQEYNNFEGNNETFDYPFKGPKNSLGLQGRFDEVYTETKFFRSITEYMFVKTQPFEPRHGFHLIVHDPFEVPNDDSVHLMTIPNEEIYFKVFPEIFGFDESLKDFTSEE